MLGGSFAGEGIHTLERHLYRLERRGVLGEGAHDERTPPHQRIEVGVDTVREAALDSDRLDEPRGEAAPQDGVGDLEIDVLGIHALDPDPPDPDLTLRGVRFVQQDHRPLARLLDFLHLGQVDRSAG